MFYPNRLISRPVFCVAENSEDPEKSCFPRLEYEVTSCAIPGKTFFSDPYSFGTVPQMPWSKALPVSLFCKDSIFPGESQLFSNRRICA